MGSTNRCADNVLVERRLLGQTDLSVKSGGSVGAQHLTKDKSHGIFEYAHLRVPLPKDLKGSGIFHALSTGGFPESYFLMVRAPIPRESQARAEA